MKKLTPPEWPVELTNARWQKQKSILTQNTGLGEKLTKAQKAFEAIKWTTFDPLSAKTNTDWEAFQKHVIEKWTSLVKPVQTQLRTEIRTLADNIAKDKKTDKKTKVAAEAVSKKADWFAVEIQLNGIFFTAVGENIKELLKAKSENSEPTAEQTALIEKLKAAVKVRESHTDVMNTLIKKYETLSTALTAAIKKPTKEQLPELKRVKEQLDATKKASIDSQTEARGNLVTPKEVAKLKEYDSVGINKLLERFDFVPNKKASDALLAAVSKAADLVAKLELALSNEKDTLIRLYKDALKDYESSKASISTKFTKDNIASQKEYEVVEVSLKDKIARLERGKVILQRAEEIHKRAEKSGLKAEISALSAERNTHIAAFKNAAQVYADNIKLLKGIKKESLPVQ